MARRVDIGDWGTLTIYEHGEEPPDGLHGAAGFWEGDDRRRPTELKTVVGVAPYVAVWPADGPPPIGPALTEESLQGVALANPVTHHRCFVCEQEVVGLHVDAGADFFGLRGRRHEWLTHCPSCGADATSARLSGMFPVPRTTAT